MEKAGSLPGLPIFEDRGVPLGAIGDEFCPKEHEKLGLPGDFRAEQLGHH